MFEGGFDKAKFDDIAGETCSLWCDVEDMSSSDERFNCLIEQLIDKLRLKALLERIFYLLTQTFDYMGVLSGRTVKI